MFAPFSKWLGVPDTEDSVSSEDCPPTRIVPSFQSLSSPNAIHCDKTHKHRNKSDCAAASCPTPPSWVTTVSTLAPPTNLQFMTDRAYAYRKPYSKLLHSQEEPEGAVRRWAVSNYSNGGHVFQSPQNPCTHLITSTPSGLRSTSERTIVPRRVLLPISMQSGQPVYRNHNESNTVSPTTSLIQREVLESSSVGKEGQHELPLQGPCRSIVHPDPLSQLVVHDTTTCYDEKDNLRMNSVQLIDKRLDHSSAIMLAETSATTQAQSVLQCSDVTDGKNCIRPAILAAIEAAQARKANSGTISKEFAAGPHEQSSCLLKTDFSSLRRSSSTDTKKAEDPKKESLHMYKATLQRLSRLKQTVASLENAVEKEHKDMVDLDAAVHKSKLTLHDVCHNLKTAQEIISMREEQLVDADRRFKFLTAEDLSECLSGDLEDISDVLWTGLQSATLALSRRQDRLLTAGKSEAEDTQTITKREIALSDISIDIPEAKFAPPERVVLQDAHSQSESLCSQLEDLLQTIKEIQRRAFTRIKTQSKEFEELHASIMAKNESYGLERKKLLTVERKLGTRLSQVNRLTGRDACEDLNVHQLLELCKSINKASRKLALEMALREVKAHQQQEIEASNQESNKELEKSGKCFVCFECQWDTELGPCKHRLCGNCAGRLNICPKCRKQIESREKVQDDESEKNDTV